jgi:rare lipoprotein A
VLIAPAKQTARMMTRITLMMSALVAAACAMPAAATSAASDRPGKSGNASRTAERPAHAVNDARDVKDVTKAANARSGKNARGANGARLDRSGRKQVGKASYYAPKFAGRKMADGTRMDPRDDNAASKTLPLGTTARVTNLENGRSASVTIQDRGPYVAGRIIDLSPSTAQQIGVTRQEGIAPVEVAPIAVPQEDGGVKPGDGARQASR